MKFDKARVYTALNADELEIGSICFLADTIAQLREYVESENDEYKHKIDHIFSERVAYRFCDKGVSHFLYAYLIEPPAEPKYEPFESIEEAMEAIKAHGGWVKDTMHNRCYAIVAYDEDTVETDQDTVGVDALFDGFVFADDGSPCGVPVEE